jgi:O-antigen ligase
MTAAAEKLAYRASLAGVALMIVVPPLNPFHLAPLPSFIEEWLALLLGLAAFAFGVWACRFRIEALPRSVPWLLAFAVVLAAQAGLRDLPYREQALLPALYVLWAAALAWVGLALREGFGAERTARVLASGVLLAAGASAILAIVQASGLHTPLDALVSRPQSERAYANLNQANLLADLLALGAVSAIFLRAGGVLGAAAAAGCAALLAAAMALTGSRSGFAFIAWTLAWSAWWVRTSPAETSRRAARLAIFLVVAFVAAQLALVLVGAPATSVPATRAMGMAFAEEGPGSVSVRRYIWLQALHMFGASPLFGAGPGMFAWNFFLNAPEFEGVRVPGGERFAHDLVLQLLAETGLAGAVLVVVPLALWLASNRRPGAEPWRWWCAAFVGVGLLHSLVENPLWYAHFLGPFAVVLGLGDRARPAPRSARVARIVAPALVLVGALSLFNAAAGYRRAIAWLHGAPGSGTLAAMQRSILRPYAELLASSSAMPPGKLDPDDLEASARLVRFMPIDLAVYRHIRLLAQAGRADEARSLLGRAVVVYPDTLADLRRELESAPDSAEARELLRVLDTRVGK